MALMRQMWCDLRRVDGSAFVAACTCSCDDLTSNTEYDSTTEGKTTEGKTWYYNYVEAKVTQYILVLIPRQLSCTCHFNLKIVSGVASTVFKLHPFPQGHPSISVSPSSPPPPPLLSLSLSLPLSLSASLPLIFNLPFSPSLSILSFLFFLSS